MSQRGKRKAFGLTKKKSCDLHHCKKKKQTPSVKISSEENQIKHLRVGYLK